MTNGPKISEDAIPGQAYGSLRSAWKGYSIALQNDNEDTAKQFASVINGIRAAFGQDPLSFKALDGYSGVELNQGVNVDLPDGWESVGGRIEDHYPMAENENGVEIGYKQNSPDSFPVWAGRSWDDRKVIETGYDTESEAKIAALEYMRDNPNVEYESGRGVGTLNQPDWDRIEWRFQE